MTDFTASNGVRVNVVVGIDGRPYLIGDSPRKDGLEADTHATGSKEGIEALREFFRAEEDDALGRWRWPAEPHWVVYADEDGDVTALDERTGESTELITRLSAARFPHAKGSAAARAYFDAHPEPKPWQSPVTGQVWALSLDGDEPTAWAVNHDNLFMDAYSTLDPKSRMITDGRRIWPEGDA